MNDLVLDNGIVWLTIFVLSVFVGIEVISKVSSTLHTPLMSGANAIHGIILLGAILVTGTTDSTVALVVGLIAIVLAAINMVGGFVVTDRMLQMFVAEASASPPLPRRGRRLMPTWAQLALPARRGLLHPRAQGPLRPQDRAQRQPDRRRRRRGGLRRSRSSTSSLDHVAADPGGDRDRLGYRRRRRRAGADDPDAADGGAVQRRRRRRGRAGRAARAAAHRRHRLGATGFFLVATAFTILVGSVSFAGSVVTFAKLQELMTSRPVVFPGLPIVFGGAFVAAIVLSVLIVTDPSMCAGHRARPARPAGRRAAGAAGRRRRRTDRDLAAQRLHRPHRRRRRLRAVQHVLAGGRHARRRLRHLPDPADGRRHGPLGGQHPLRRPQGRLHARRRRGVRPAGALRHPRGRRDHAQLRRARRSSCPATASRSPRRSTRCASSSTCSTSAAASRSTTRSTRSPAGCPGT